MRRVPALSLLVVSALFAAPAAAESDAASRAKARELTERAIEKTKAGEHEAAIELYLRAYELSSEAILLSNIGSAYQTLGRRERALRYFCRYLDADANGKLAGFAREQAKQLAIDLGNRGPACEKPASETSVTPPSPAGEDPVEPTSDEPSREGPDITASTEVGRRREPALAAPLRISGLVLAGGGVIGLGIGGYYGYVGKRASDIISDNDDGWTADELEQQEIGERANSRMKIALISGGAAVLTGAALYLWGRSMRVEENRISIAPQLTPGSSGLVVSGVFD